MRFSRTLVGLSLLLAVTYGASHAQEGGRPTTEVHPTTEEASPVPYGTASGDPTAADWFSQARIGGFSIDPSQLLDEGAPVHIGGRGSLEGTDLDAGLSNLLDQNVNVVEGDSRLSDYMTEPEWQAELKVVADAARVAHSKGMRIIYYYPSLEVITADGKKYRNLPPSTSPDHKTTFAKDHPDWLQLSFDGYTRNYFYGSKVFWVEPPDESAWACPNSPYRDYYYDKLRRVAAAGVDAIWMDVPLFNLVEGNWCCTCHYCQAKFTHDTGLPFPQHMSFRDPSFWRYVQWRHETIRDFLSGAAHAIHEVNPNTKAVVEVVSLDHLGATDWGADGTYMKDVNVVWEVDDPSDTTGMSQVGQDDWLSQMAVYKFCRGAIYPARSWAFSYGYRDADAQLVMSSCLAAQVNPYELRVPHMTSSVGHDFRQKMFGWIKENSDRFFQSTSASQALILYSSLNRDFLDGTRENAYYVSTVRPERDVQWWASEPEESAYRTKYLSEYRGWAKLLIKSHTPFDIRPLKRVTLQDLMRYPAVILPRGTVLSQAEHDMLVEYARHGHLLVTGADAGKFDENAHERKTSLWTAGTSGVSLWPQLLGTDYYHSTAPAILQQAQAWLAQAGVKPLLASSSLPVYVQAYDLGSERIVEAMNYGWVGRLGAKPQPMTVPFSVPCDHLVHQVLLSIPGEKPQPLAFTQSAGQVNFQATFPINAMVVLQ